MTTWTFPRAGAGEGGSRADVHAFPLPQAHVPSLEPGPPALPVPKSSSSVLRPPDSRWEGSGPHPGVARQATPPLSPSPWVDGQGAPPLSPRCFESP